MGLDSKCPHCRSDIESDIRSKWEAHDYGPSFSFQCPACEEGIEITVHTVPEFQIAKHRCALCRSVEIQEGHYCRGCHAKLKAMSDHNEALAKQ